MEILIVGAILVAVMVAVSTKIKKSAANAYIEETIKTDDFIIVKPDGFIHPLNENSKHAFAAHSKEMGKAEAEEFYQAEVKIKAFSDTSFDEATKKIKLSGNKILSEKTLDDPPQNQRICFLETEETKNKTKIFSFWKIVENIQKGKIYELQIRVLEDFRDEYRERIDKMLESFAVR